MRAVVMMAVLVATTLGGCFGSSSIDCTDEVGGPDARVSIIVGSLRYGGVAPGSSAAPSVAGDKLPLERTEVTFWFVVPTANGTDREDLGTYNPDPNGCILLPLPSHHGTYQVNATAEAPGDPSCAWHASKSFSKTGNHVVDLPLTLQLTCPRWETK